MAVDVEQIGIIAHSCNDVLVPDLGQQRTAGLFQGLSSLWLFWSAVSAADRRFARLAL